jgi:hypothetical protein
MVLSDELEGMDLGDARLNERGMSILSAISANPARSFPKMADTWGTLKAMYRFFRNPKVTRGKILYPHIRQTVRRCEWRNVVLAVQDTTTLSYSTHSAAAGLGHVGAAASGLGWGMLVHHVMAVDGETREPLGMLSQEVIVRERSYPSGETYKERLTRSRESEKWLRGLWCAKDLLKGHPKVIHVADREADIYFFMQEILQLCQGFVIRYVRNRLTEDGCHTNDWIAHAIPKGDMLVTVPRNGKRRERQARVTLRSCTVAVCPPKVIDRKGMPLPVHIVVVEELKPPKGMEPLFWVLLTSEPLDTCKDCEQVVRYYQTRWIIEEFHKGLKTGCQMEERQLAGKERLENALAFFSIMASQLLYVRYCAHTGIFREPYEGVSESQCLILRHKFPKECAQLNAQKTMLLIARMGGFIGRKSDGLPGWLTLMRGMYDLLLIEQGLLLGQKLVGKG